MTIFLRAPSGTRIERTEAYVAQAEQIVRQAIPADELSVVISNAGILYDWPAAYTPNSGTGDAFLQVELRGVRHASVDEYAHRLRKIFRDRIPELEMAFDTGGLMTAALSEGATSPISLALDGASYKDAPELTREMIQRASAVPGTVDVRLQERLDYPSVRVDVDRIRAAMLGMNEEEVVKSVAAALTSSVNFDPAFWIDPKNGNHYFVGVQYREGDIQDFNTVLDVPITPRAGGVAVPLRQVATLTRHATVGEVRHENIRRVFQVLVNVRGRDVGSVAADLERAMASVKLPRGAKVEVRGEVVTMKKSLRDLAGGVGLAVVLVYLVLVAQFRSFVDPLIVLVAVPLGSIGAVGLLFVTGCTLNVQSLVGVLFMVGIAISNSVLLVDFAGRLRRQGLGGAEAAVRSATIRLRPVLMTTFAAVLGLVPMALGLQRGDEANVPLARAVAGGLAASTILTLFVVPALDAWLHGRRPVTPPRSEAA
jgi:multidrug efflux pump subunit AcrB